MTQYYLDAIKELKRDFERHSDAIATAMSQMVSKAEFNATIETLKAEDKHLKDEIEKSIQVNREEAVRREGRTRWQIGISVSVASILSSGIVGIMALITRS